MHTVSNTHRRINAPLEFHGLKAQYILYAGGIIVAGLMLVAILYIAGLNTWLCLLFCFGSGGAGIGWMYYLSHHYGVHGWRKRQAARRIPRMLRCGSRRIFLQLKK